MAYNPITGEFESGGESYSAPTIGVGAAMEGMSAVGADVPFAFRMMENMPGTAAGFGFNARRFSNTMFRGGFLDIEAGAKASKVARARKFGAFVGDVAEKPGAKGFLFGGMRNPEKLAGKTQFFKASRVNNFTLRPRIFNRMSSVSALSGMPNQGFYTPFQGTGLLNPLAEKAGLRKRMVARGTISAGDQSPLFSGGFLGRMSTMSKVYSMEQKQARLRAKGTSRATARADKIGDKLSDLDRNLFRTAKQGYLPAYSQPYSRAADLAMQEARFRVGARIPGAEVGLHGPAYVTPSALEAVDQQALRTIQGNRLRAISDSSTGVLTRSMTEYFGTVLDPNAFRGTRAFAALEKNITTAMSGVGSAKAGPISPSVATKAADFLAGQYVDDVGKYGVKSLGTLSGRAFAAGEKKVALKLAGAAGTRALGLALPGLNVIATASLVYDLTKMAGKAIVSAGNFAKDAVKSMQGSIHKPAFGMGYKDNEVAATSRARGVLAIQNSRLNARSALGAEASMMAAHFG